MKHRRECNKQIDQQDRRIRCDCDDDEYDKDGGDSDQDENVEGWVHDAVGLVVRIGCWLEPGPWSMINMPHIVSSYVVYPTDTNATELEEEQEDEEDYVKGMHNGI